MIKRKHTLEYLKAICFGCNAAWLALACNGSPEAGDEPPPEPLLVVDRDDCEDNPYLATCPPIDDGKGDDNESMLPPGMTPTRTPEDLARDQAQNVLLSNCGGCHGTQLTREAAEAGMNYIDDMLKLEDNDKIVALDADASPIIRRMRDGSMPPGLTRVREADIEIVASYINNPLYWPDAVKPASCNNPAVDFDQLYEAVARDLQRQESEDQPFLRYVSLANRVTAGVCTNTALDLERQALTKMLNMLSIRAKVSVPLAVDTEQTLFRLDLREFDWDRAISVDGQPFDDVWEAIVGANTYAVPFVGDDADEARADAETDVPVMFLDSMLGVATIGNLYYSIIDVDVEESLDTFILERLGVDVQANLDNEELVRAGTTRSRISRQDRLVERHDIAVRPGVLYQSFDFNDVQNESIFQNPFGFSEGGREAIFTLPNGMLAYLIADADGNLVEDSNILLDTSQNNYRAITSVSCSGCHSLGFIPVADEVREVVIANARALIADGSLNQEQLEQLSSVYLSPDAFERTTEEDSTTFYRAALQRANLPTRGTEPVANLFVRFALDLKLADAAGDLGVGAAELRDSIQLLEPELGVLRTGTIDRDDFTALYVANLCRISGVLANRPDPAICDEVLVD